MEIEVSPVQGQADATLLGLQGDLDASNYLDLVARVRDLARAGTHDLILDMSKVRFISSSGIVALHRALLILNGVSVQEQEDGWGAMHAVAKENRPLQKRIKLVNLQPRVDSTLELAGLKDYFDIYPDLDSALSAV
jgi:anti-anti-sigma factor